MVKNIFNYSPFMPQIDINETLRFGHSQMRLNMMIVHTDCKTPSAHFVVYRFHHGVAGTWFVETYRFLFQYRMKA
jgi:hypothetical protein